MPHVSSSGGGEDLGSEDEVKVFKDEGEDEKRSSENLTEEKSSLIDLTESEVPARPLLLYFTPPSRASIARPTDERTPAPCAHLATRSRFDNTAVPIYGTKKNAFIHLCLDKYQSQLNALYYDVQSD